MINAIDKPGIALENEQKSDGKEINDKQSILGKIDLAWFLRFYDIV